MERRAGLRGVTGGGALAWLLAGVLLTAGPAAAAGSSPERAGSRPPMSLTYGNPKHEAEYDRVPAGTAEDLVNEWDEEEFGADERHEHGNRPAEPDRPERPEPPERPGRRNP